MGITAMLEEQMDELDATREANPLTLLVMWAAIGIVLTVLISGTAVAWLGYLPEV
jgi:hypothetical protein